MDANDHRMRTAEAALEAYLGDLTARNHRPGTVRAWRQYLTGFFRFLAGLGLTRLQDVETGDIEAYAGALRDRGLTEQTRHVYMRAVRQFFAHLEAAQQIFVNPAAGLILRAPPRHILFVPSLAQINKVFALCDITVPRGLRNRAFLEIVYACALRLEETAGLDLLDVDLDNGALRVMGKGRKERVVPLGEKGAFWLRLYLREARPKLLDPRYDEPALWLTAHGRRPTPQVFQKMVLAHARELGVEGFTIHSLRRACATHMLSNGAHPIHIQFLLGHSNARSLSQYLQVSITEIKRMHAASNPGQ